MILIKNNFQKTQQVLNEEGKTGAASKLAGKYMVVGHGEARRWIMNVVDTENMIFLDDHKKHLQKS